MEVAVLRSDNGDLEASTRDQATPLLALLEQLHPNLKTGPSKLHQEAGSTVGPTEEFGSRRNSMSQPHQVPVSGTHPRTDCNASVPVRRPSPRTSPRFP